MSKLGFAPAWVNSVMRTVCSVKFSVMFNGKRLEKFTPSRGLRQGDPISPYLFLFAAEGLSSLLKNQTESSPVHGIRVADTAPPVSHLLFTDDSLLFVKASVEGAIQVSSLLESYCNASGQKINLDKSSVFFSKGCSQGVKESMKTTLNVHNESLSEKYLGMPTDVGSSKNGAFKYLKDRVWNKVKGWMEKVLSSGGKEVLIKSVTQSIPVYSMACFKLPRGLCLHINSIIRKFWWGSKRGERKTNWVSWEKMTRPKYEGGLGFRDIELFNLALLARQAWRILQTPESLSAKILKARYFPTTDFLDASLGNQPSQIWRAIVEGKEILSQGLIKRIGDGRDTLIWQHNWIHKEASLRPIVCLSQHRPQFVSELIDSANARWKQDVVRATFLPIDA